MLVDSGGFNLPFARRVKRTTRARILYFIAPQVWAWRAGRIATLKRYVNRMIVIFPFEEALYRDHGVPVTWVGHPLVDRVPAHLSAWRQTLRGEHGIDPARTVVSWLPGSRRSELARLAPGSAVNGVLYFDLIVPGPEDPPLVLRWLRDADSVDIVIPMSGNAPAEPHGHG